MYRLILIFLGAALLTGCAAAALLPASSSLLPPASIAADIHNQTVVKLDQANFTLVQANVAGRSTGFSLFGLITIVPAEYTKALDQLYSHADMHGSGARTLTNLAVERTNDFWLLFAIPGVNVRADVIEFTPAPGSSASNARVPASGNSATAPSPPPESATDSRS